MENELLQLFRTHGHDDDELVAGIARLAERSGPEVYRKTLQILAGKDFTPEQAERHWEGILAHRGRLFPAQEGGRLRAALVDYLHREVGELRDPRILEATQLDEVRQASITDGLTALYRQCYFKERLEQLFTWKKPSPKDRFAVVLFDLDHFKRYNDQYGHLAGDAALKRVAETIRQSIRDYDVAARYGGEEFALLLFRVDEQQAFTICERIRACIEQTSFDLPGEKPPLRLTISGGLAFFPGDGATARELLETADQRLYKAKETRNALVPHSQDRRQAFRRAVRSIVELHPQTNGHSIPGMTSDLSNGGLSLDCAVSFEPGSTVQVRFRKPFWTQERETLATVRRVRHDKRSGLVHVGLEFENRQDYVDALHGKEQGFWNVENASMSTGR
ncbi:diguanylate cyclase [Geoalkalibacter halelectricus]|uniref:diguanylate cyclase n=1 Tax=Geoalkalibacter halelectricus TaxID=2847045 RepID=A0ABY5ZIU9_9BACT|nr:diguanylate cyclase [Geoalkalibacter halelectricus]MDO3378915.1 diguanylate cyclase [Geoalkalibacter halelectricus]UWZ79062.1 diguanylate cyclase [Geoalkalibacter halelectricus]